MKIVGIGNALVDVLAPLQDEAPLERLGLPKGGMKLIDDDEQGLVDQELALCKTEMATGGSAGNTMLALARLGNEPAFIGRIADDERGRFFRDNCTQTGIEARLIVTEGKSGVANTFITPDGERTFATHLGVAAGLSAADITAELLGGCQLLHIEGYLVQNHQLMETICRTAKEMGIRMSIDLASYNVVQDHLDFFRHLVEEYIDIVFANEEESVAFTGAQSPEQALEEIAQMCQVAVVKLGAKGASAMTKGERTVIPAGRVQVVDTTAAGDFFAGGFLHALVRGGTMEQCLLCGAAMSEAVIQVVGTRLTPKQWDYARKRVAELI